MKDEIKHIAKLSRLGMSDKQVEKFSGQIKDILDYVGLLGEVTVTDVPPTSQVTGLVNVTREDKVKRFCTKDEVLSCTELPVVNDQIKVKSVIKN